MLERMHTESTLHERDPGTLTAAAARPAQAALPPAALGLAWRTRATTRTLLHGLAVALAIAVFTGVGLWLDPAHDGLHQVMLLSHLAAGALASILFVAFATIHLRDGREPLACVLLPLLLLPRLRADRFARRRLVGHGLLWVLALAVLSGLAIAAPGLAYLSGHPQTLPYGMHVWLLELHLWATPALGVGLAWHLPWGERT
jgi:Na+/proline symporter